MFSRITTATIAFSCALLSSAQCVTTFPSTEPFTSFTVGTPGTLANNWTNLTGDDLNWNVDDNGTPSANTGPYGDHTTYNTAGKYMYVEATGAGATPNKSAILQSPCHDISAVSGPYLTFWYHMEGSQMGTLAVDLNLNGAITSNLWNVTGDQGHWWKQGWLSLAPYGTQTNLRVRFRAVTGSGDLSDIAIDDVRVGSLSPVFGCTESTASNYNSSANVNNGTCDYGCPAGNKRVRVDLIADNYPNEMSWDLKNASTGATLASGTSLGSSLCVPSATCMVFTMHDSYGDGICCGYGNGAYFLYFDGALIATGGNYTTQQQTTFNCGPGQSCSTPVTAVVGPTYTAPALEYWADFTPTATGSYSVTTCGLNTCDTKIWLYDMACASIVLSSGVEGATFADDNLGGCGLQAKVTGNLQGGTLYHIRLGTNAGSCTSIIWQIIYNGPAIGCMNTASCNYDPLATVPCTGCCLAAGNPGCPPGPDLQMDQATLQGSLNMATVSITDACAPQEGCVKAMGTRQVLRFSTRINNIGQTDYYIGSPSSQPQMFSTTNCHGHAHYQGYADYVLFDPAGHVIPVGFKNGFCVIDVGCPTGTAHYGCSNMGISAGCYDQYGSGTTCNWIDVTDVPDGTYTLVLRTNWSHMPDALGRHETSYTNNYAQVCINLAGFGGTRTFTTVTTCPTWTDCLGQPYGDARLDCNGVCNGPTKTGDLSLNAVQDQPDAQFYALGILGDDVSTGTCTDLNNDGEITVTDGALMVNCYTQRDAYEGTVPAPYIHYHPWCEFPRGYLSTIDTAWLTIGAFDQINKTIDIHIKNPTCRVMGYEFTMSGLTIQTVENLVTSLTGEIAVNTSLGGQKVLGLSYLDSSMAKSSAFTPLCRIHYLALTSTQVCISAIQDIVNKDANNITTFISGSCANATNVVAVNVKALLEGPFDGTALMNDGLRAAGLIPTTEPYTALGFTQAAGGGGEAVNPSVFDVTGNNAIVDWVLVELRSSTTPSTVVATRGALIQRDGDVVGLDGTGTVVLNASPGDYYVAVRHRNHLGVMTATAIALSTTPASIDFRSGTAVWGTQARKTVGSNQVLYAGNVFREGAVSLLKYTGVDNDRDPILQIIGGTVPTNTMTGYYREDVDMSGTVKYTGAGNDRDPILSNIGGVVPTNTKLEQLP